MKVQWKTKGLLLMASLLNAAIAFLSFWFMVFATSPDMDDVTMRLGFYVVNLILMVAIAAIFVPWIFAHRNQNTIAMFVALLPALLICLAVLAFVTLDSWLNRTFSAAGARTVIASPAHGDSRHDLANS